jgi:hypothetical protein
VRKYKRKIQYSTNNDREPDLKVYNQCRSFLAEIHCHLKQSDRFLLWLELLNTLEGWQSRQSFNDEEHVADFYRIPQTPERWETLLETLICKHFPAINRFRSDAKIEALFLIYGFKSVRFPAQYKWICGAIARDYKSEGIVRKQGNRVNPLEAVLTCAKELLKSSSERKLNPYGELRRNLGKSEMIEHVPGAGPIKILFSIELSEKDLIVIKKAAEKALSKKQT